MILNKFRNVTNLKPNFSLQNWVLILAFLMAGSSCSLFKKSTESKGKSAGQVSSTDEEVNTLFLDGMQDLMLEKRSDAFIKFTEVVKKQPKNAAAHYQLSRLWSEKKDIQNAIIEIKLAKKYDPENKWMLEEYANLMFLDGQFLKAAEVYGALAAKSIDKESFLYKQAYSYSWAGKLEESLNILTQLQSLKAEYDESIQLTKAEVYLKLEQKDSALSILHSLSKYNPSNPAYPSLLSIMYSKAGEKDKALKQLTDFQERNPDDTGIKSSLLNYNISEKPLMASKYADEIIKDEALTIEEKLSILNSANNVLKDGQKNMFAEHYLPQLAQMDTITGSAKFQYGVFLYAVEKPDSALVQLKEAIAMDSSNLPAYGYILNLVFSKEKADDLIFYSIKGEKAFPELAIFNYFSAVGYYFNDEYSQSVASAERGIEKTSLYDTARMISLNALLGDTYQKVNQNEKAEKSYEKALKYEYKNPTVLNNYSYYLAVNNKDLNRALKMAELAISLEPKQANYLDTYGWVLYKKGDFKKAKTYLSKALEHAEEESKKEIFEHLGDTEVQLGNPHEALAYWLKAKEHGGDSEELLRKIRKEQEND